MAEKRSVYLSTQALSMPRRMDSLSGRINQALDRYACILARDGPRIRSLFTAEQWAHVVDAAKAWRHMRPDVLPGEVEKTIQRIAGPMLRDCDSIILADIAEGDL